MPHIICQKAQIPIRKEPNHRSEQVSQLLFGETAKTPENHGTWLRITTSFDNYSGWIEADAATVITEQEAKINHIIISEAFYELKHEQYPFYIPCGSELPPISVHNSFTIAKQAFELTKEIKNEPQNPIEVALRFLHAPYLWGGRTAMGIDCSGLVQIAFKVCGIALPRDASMQIKEGEKIAEFKDAMPGDLCFFNNEQGDITHVGIFLADDQIIHASKSVRIDSIDDKGIFNKDMGKYTHTFHSIRRLI